MNETAVKNQKESSIFGLHSIIKIGLLAAVGRILMLLEFALPIFPSFLKIDISDVTSVIATLAMGPAAGIMVELIKNILKLFTGTSSLGIGELANFVVGTAFMLPLGLVHRKDRTVKGFLIGAAIGSLLMVITACLFNYFILIPAYANIIFKAPIDTFVGMANKVNAMVTSFETLILYAVAPFNLIKAISISVIGVLIYKLLKPVLYKF